MLTLLQNLDWKDLLQALQTEVAAFGINTTIVNPGFFRTELLTEQSTKYADNPIADYTEKREQLMRFWKGANGQQSGDPAKLTKALITIENEEKPPIRFLAGADVVNTAVQVSTTLNEQAKRLSRTIEQWLLNNGGNVLSLLKQNQALCTKIIK